MQSLDPRLTDLLRVISDIDDEIEARERRGDNTNSLRAQLDDLIVEYKRLRAALGDAS